MAALGNQLGSAIPAVQQQFKLNEQQYNQLNQGYGQSYTRYQEGIKALGTDLTDAQRSQKMNELRQGFYEDFSGTADKVFTDPQQRQRYEQLHLQYQGYNAFSDPRIQDKLNLTAEQRQKIGQNGQDWHKQMSDLGQTYQSDPEGSTKKYNEMRKQYGERLNGILTPEQQKSWQQMTGESYNFPASSYFQTNPSGGSTNPPKQ
jgi:hypothetical protein